MATRPALKPPESGFAWVTGASSGIGRALALRLAECGWNVVASARSRDALQELADEAVPLHGWIDPAPMDVTDRAASEAVLAEMEAARGPCVLAVLNAGTHIPVDVESFAAEPFEQLLKLNVLGQVYGLEALLRRFRERRGGQVALVSSIAGYSGLPTSSAYGASKAAVINMCEALRLEAAQHGISVQVINPGFVRTPLTNKNKFEMPFLIEVEDAVDAMVRGLADPGRFEITFPWRFAMLMKLLRILPYRLYFPLVARMTGFGGKR